MNEVFISPSERETLIPIPLRGDLVVKIVGLPSDLTKQEATRIGNVVMALAIPEGAERYG